MGPIGREKNVEETLEVVIIGNDNVKSVRVWLLAQANHYTLVNKVGAIGRGAVVVT